MNGWEGEVGLSSNSLDGAVAMIGRFARAIFTINASRNYHVIFDLTYWNNL